MDKIHFDQLLTFAFKAMIFIGILALIRAALKKRYKSKMDSALHNYTKGNYKKALDFLNVHLLNNPDDIAALILRGESYYYVDKLENAKYDFISAIELDERCSKCHYFMGQIEVRSGNKEAAIEEFNKANEIDPDNILIISQRAVVHFYLDNYQKSKEDYQKAIELSPENRTLFLPYLAYCDFQLYNYDTAFDLFEEAIKFNRNNPLIYRFRGFMNFYLTKYNDAINDFETAIVLDEEYDNELKPLINQARAKMN